MTWTCVTLTVFSFFCPQLFFQYGVCLLVFVNVNRYMKIVHNRGMSASRRSRSLVIVICGCIPAVSATVDMFYWQTIRLSPTSPVMFCYNAMPPIMKDLSFWLRMTVSFLLPTVAIIYCNSMIVHTVKNHIQNTVLGKRVTRTYRRAKILPMVTVASFVCCWTPWIVSVLYFRSHRHCNVATVLNICTGVGHLYCLSNPVLYIFVKRRSNGTLRAMRKSTSS